MVGSVPFHDRHVFLCHKGPANWPENPFSFDWDCMPRRLRADIKAREEEMQRKTMFTVCEGRDVPGSYNGDILVFPEMLIYRSLTRFDVECFVDEALVQEQPRLLWPEPLTGCHIFVCCHVTRDSLCGAIGPQVVAKFREEIELRGLIDVHVWPCCHLSQNVSMDACVGNVSVFKRSKPSCNNCGRRRSEDRFLSGARRQQLPPEALAALVAAASAGQTGEVRGDWYGQVMPDDVADVMELHVMGDSVVERLWRGRMGLWPQQQVEEQADRLGSMRCVSAEPEASSERTPGSASGSALSDAGSEVCSCAPAAVTRSFSAQFISPQTTRSSSEASKGSNNSPCEYAKCGAGGVAHSPSSTLDAVNRLRSASFHSCSSASYSSTSIASVDPAVSDVRGELPLRLTFSAIRFCFRDFRVSPSEAGSFAETAQLMKASDAGGDGGDRRHSGFSPPVHSPLHWSAAFAAAYLLVILVLVVAAGESYSEAARSPCEHSCGVLPGGQSLGAGDAVSAAVLNAVAASPALDVAAAAADAVAAVDAAAAPTAVASGALETAATALPPFSPYHPLNRQHSNPPFPEPTDASTSYPLLPTSPHPGAVEIPCADDLDAVAWEAGNHCDPAAQGTAICWEPDPVPDADAAAAAAGTAAGRDNPESSG
ncbi:unnamed protein product [Closterium sp. NIES-53]